MMGKPFSVNINRFDPYKISAFAVYLDDSVSPLQGVTRVSGLRVTSEPIPYCEGSNAIALVGIGRSRYAPITIERGLTHDNDLESWANAAQVLTKGTPSRSLKNLRKTLRIVLLNEEHQPVHQYIVHRCWVSEYQALPDLDASRDAVAIEYIKLEHEGWEHDLSVREPEEE
jgi:phage tail-like protein